MLTFDNAMIFLSNLKSNLSVSFNFDKCGSDVVF